MSSSSHLPGPSIVCACRLRADHHPAETNVLFFPFFSFPCSFFYFSCLKLRVAKRKGICFLTFRCSACCSAVTYAVKASSCGCVFIRSSEEEQIGGLRYHQTGWRNPHTRTSHSLQRLRRLSIGQTTTRSRSTMQPTLKRNVPRGRNCRPL